MDVEILKAGATDDLTQGQIDGPLFWVRTFPVPNQLAKVYCLAGIAEQISKRKRVAAELLNALATEKNSVNLKLALSQGFLTSFAPDQVPFCLLPIDWNITFKYSRVKIIRKFFNMGYQFKPLL